MEKVIKDIYNKLESLLLRINKNIITWSTKTQLFSLQYVEKNGRSSILITATGNSEVIYGLVGKYYENGKTMWIFGENKNLWSKIASAVLNSYSKRLMK